MKRTILFLIFMVSAFMMVCGTAQAKIFYLSIPSGVTIDSSGSSPFQHAGASGVTFISIENLNDSGASPFIFVQLRSASGLTVSNTERIKNGLKSDQDDTVVTIFYRQSLVNTQEAWDSAVTGYVWRSVKFSGVTMTRLPARCDFGGFVQFGIESGATQIGRADFIVHVME